jgi:hypothetical protein
MAAVSLNIAPAGQSQVAVAVLKFAPLGHLQAPDASASANAGQSQVPAVLLKVLPGVQVQLADASSHVAGDGQSQMPFTGFQAAPGGQVQTWSTAIQSRLLGQLQILLVESLQV